MKVSSSCLAFKDKKQSMSTLFCYSHFSSIVFCFDYGADQENNEEEIGVFEEEHVPRESVVEEIEEIENNDKHKRIEEENQDDKFEGEIEEGSCL